MAQAILKSIADEDKLAVQKCVDTYGGLIFSLARRMLPNADEAEDAVQEIFIDIWKNAGRFDEAMASETTFVAMIARRRLIDRMRRQNRRLETDSIEDMTTEPEQSRNQSLQTCVEAKESARAMKNLRPEQRQILHLSIVQGFSHQEISDNLNIPLGTVKTHARRGLLKVREVLGLNDSNEIKEATV